LPNIAATRNTFGQERAVDCSSLWRVRIDGRAGELADEACTADERGRLPGDVAANDPGRRFVEEALEDRDRYGDPSGSKGVRWL